MMAYTCLLFLFFALLLALLFIHTDLFLDFCTRLLHSLRPPYTTRPPSTPCIAYMYVHHVGYRDRGLFLFQLLSSYPANRRRRWDETDHPKVVCLVVAHCRRRHDVAATSHILTYSQTQPLCWSHVRNNERRCM